MNSIAAAKRRRAQPEGTKPAMTITSTTAPSQPAAQRMTPQQYLSMLESKISALEKNMSSQPSVQIEVNGPDGKKKMDLSDYMADVDQKFMVLAEEISSLKDSLLKLQTFTLDVNQSMFNKLSKEEIQEENTQNILPTVSEEIVSEEIVNEVIVNNEIVNEEIIREDIVNEVIVNEETNDEDEIIGVTKNKKGRKKH